MKKNELENIFRNKLGQYETPFDVDQGWRNLEPKISQRKRRRKVFILFLLGTVAAGIIFSYNYVLNEELANPVRATEKLEKVSAGNDVQLEQEVIEKSAENRLLQLIEEVDDHIKEDRNPSKNGKSTPSEKNMIDKDQLNASLLSDPYDHLINGELGTSENGHSSSTSEEFSDDEKVGRLLEGHPMFEDGTNIANSLAEIKGLKLKYFTLREPELDVPEKVTLRLDDQSRTWHDWSLSFQGGFGKYNNNFNIIEGGDISIANEKSFLSELESFSFSGRVKYSLNKKWALNTGLEYFQSNEKFDYANSTTTSRVVEGTQKIIYNPISGDSTFVIGPVNQMGNEWIEVVHYNKYVNWNIPLGISYKMGNRAIQFNPGVGLVLNVAHQKSGKELFMSEVVQSSIDELSKNNVGVSVYFEPQISYRLSDSYFFLLSPGIRKSVNNWSRQEGVSQKPLQYYVFMGVEKRL